MHEAAIPRDAWVQLTRYARAPASQAAKAEHAGEHHHARECAGVKGVGERIEGRMYGD